MSFSLIDEIPEIIDMAKDDDFDSGDLEPIDIDRMCNVLTLFKEGDAAILSLVVEHLTDTSEITTAQQRDCIERLHKAAMLMERKT